jgi:isopenicillin-N epimerase
VVVDIPFPLTDPEEVVEAVLGGVSNRTRIVLLDHITSPTGLVLPIDRILRLLDERGIECIVDGAHAPGMVDLDIRQLAPAYYTGNCHKWLCTPKGAAFLYVRRDLQERIRPLTISHGANSPRTDRSRMHLEFDWPGTMDPTAWMCIPAALDFMAALYPDGWPELRRRNRELVLAGRHTLCETLDIGAPAPESMIGSLATVPIPAATTTGGSVDPLSIDPLQDALFREVRIEVPIWNWPSPPKRIMRVSAQAYNRPEQYAELARAVKKRLG